MKIKEMKIEFSYTKNMGNFNSCRIGEEMTISFENESDNEIEEIKEEVYQILKDSVREKFRRMKA